MMPQRFAPAQSSAVRKSRIGDGRPSMLPKPRRPGSTDRLSTEARRPSTAGHRSSSAEPSRNTYAGGRLSREASATKLPLNGRSRSQQGDRFGQSLMTPMRSGQYAARTTNTPQKTPSEDRRSRTWQASLDRALAFVTIKDTRATSNVAWQRAELCRVQAALAARGGGGGGGGMALVRPLTIARFVEITGALLDAITRDAKLNNDNYVAKLPHLSKRLLYPGTVSKSWLKTVNTLHAFPHALALIAYLLDLVNHIEMPVSDEWLYVEKDELACLRRDYLDKCWIRFQEPGHQFEDLTEEYLQKLQVLLGNDEEKIAELNQVIQDAEYELSAMEEASAAARAAEARLAARRDALLAALRSERALRRDTRAAAEAEAQRHLHLNSLLDSLDKEIERATAESQQLKVEVESQDMSVAERTRLLDEVDYALRVQDSKRALADQIAKMVLSKETELALWQKKTLDSCLEYKQGLIHLSAQFPELASLAIDEKELMVAGCGARVAQAVGALRGCAGGLGARRADCARQASALARRRHQLLEETRTKITEMKASIQREQQTLEVEISKESAEAADWSKELQDTRDKLQALADEQRNYARVKQELEYWEKQEQAWSSKLECMRQYIEATRGDCSRLLEAACARRRALLLDTVALLNDKLAQC